MDSSRTSFDLLAHFDSHEAGEDSRQPLRPPIGVVCVLTWAVAAGVLFFAACTLLQLGYCIAAERALLRAARAGMLEATLPRATHESIVKNIERRLVDYSIPAGALQITLRQNDAPLQRIVRLADDDRVSVAISLSADAVLPAWLRTVNCWNDASQIEARIEQQMPGRQVQIAERNYPAAE
jgi:hypothetical protein